MQDQKNECETHTSDIINYVCTYTGALFVVLIFVMLCRVVTLINRTVAWCTCSIGTVSSSKWRWWKCNMHMSWLS